MSKINLSKQQQKILLALSCIEGYSYKNELNPIYSIIELIEPAKIKKHYHSNRYHIDKTRYASYHRSLKVLCEKNLISNLKLINSKKKGCNLYELTKEGKKTVDNIVSTTVDKYNRIKPFLLLINKISYKYNISFDKVYALYGVENPEDYTEYIPDTLLRIFYDFKDGIKYIEDLEADKKNYMCWKCDNDRFMDKDFKKKECPNCKGKIDFYYKYLNLMIYDWKLNHDEKNSTSYYECKYEEHQVKERFSLDSEYTYREVNIKIL